MINLMPKKSQRFSWWSKPKVEPDQPSKKTLIQTQSYAGMTWIDIEDPTKESLAEAADRYKLHELHIEQCLQASQVTQMNREEHYIFLIFYFPYYIKATKRIATSQVSIFLGNNFLLTLHDSTQKLIVDQMFREYKANDVQGPKTPGRMLYQLIHYLLKDTANLIQDVLQELDDIECHVYSGHTSDTQKIGQLRKKIASLGRTVGLQHEILQDLDEAIDQFSKEHIARYYKNNTKFSQKLTQNILEAKETIEIYKDADFITNTEKTNDILAVLTLLFTLTIPAAVLGAFYGMNVEIPGGTAHPWNFWGPYTTFTVVILGSIAAAAIMFAYFKKKKWF